MAKQRQRQLSVLVIPDDGSRTLEFKVGYWVLRMAACGLVILLVLVFAGAVFYWRAHYWEGVARTYSLDNQRLKGEVTRVEELAKMVTHMKQVDQQMRTMLSTSLKLASAPYSVPVESRATPDAVESSPVQITTVSGTASPFLRGSSGVRWIPSIWPVARSIGWVTRSFESQIGIFKNRHLGIDIAAPDGSQIRSTADGKVIFSGLDDRLGQMVVLDHDGAFMTRYGHASSLLVREGELVTKGQWIALVGNTGISTGPHLHYEIWEQGIPRNPELYLPD